jgi:hypothetical protein
MTLPRIFAAIAVVASTALALLTVCGGSSPPETSVDDVFQEYAESTDVRNDPLDIFRTAEERVAQFADRGQQQVLNLLLAPEACGSSECPADADYQRFLLVRHEDESLEVMTLYVMDRPRGTDVLVDSTGESYTGGLDDFRKHNDLLDSDDLILAPSGITAMYETEIVVVSGHTPSAFDAWRPWLIGASASASAVGLGGLATLFLLRRRRTGARASGSMS